jgi:hypothetical protein
VPCNREYTRAEEQIGKVAGVNKLAANLAPELNNPAATAKSAASHQLSAAQASRRGLPASATSEEREASVSRANLRGS